MRIPKSILFKLPWNVRVLYHKFTRTEFLETPEELRRREELLRLCKRALERLKDYE